MVGGEETTNDGIGGGGRRGRFSFLCISFIDQGGTDTKAFAFLRNFVFLLFRLCFFWTKM